MKIKKLLFSGFMLSTILLTLGSCKSTDHKTGFALQQEIWEERDSTDKPIYLTSTKPIDSIDVNKLCFDIWRHEIDDYPKEIRLMARVYDSTGNFVTNMAKPYLKDTTANYWTGLREKLGIKRPKGPFEIDSFTVREYGANDSIPYNIVLSVDYSGSMTGVLETIFEGTEIFVNLKMKYDNIALSTFNKDYDLKVPLMNDKQKILNIYRTKRKNGLGLFTAAYDAINNSINILEPTDKEVPRVMVIFTDGDDNYSQTKIGELIDRAKKEKIHVFAVAFGYSKDDNLRYIAEYTGGRFYKAYTKEELIAIFRDIYMSLRYYYLISYRPPKYWGWHFVTADLKVTGRKDTMLAKDKYDTSNLNPWDSVGKEFERPILFDFDSAIVKPPSFPILDEIAEKMYEMDGIKLEIQGHTDNVGKVDYNQDLSDRRAKAVLDALVERGVERRRLRSRGFGESMPVEPNDTEDGRAKNRRTMFVIIAK